MKSGQVAKIGTAALLSLGVLGGTVSMASAEQNGDGQAEKQQFLASPRTLAQAIAAAEKESGGKAMDASWEAAGTAGAPGLFEIELVKPDGTVVWAEVNSADGTVRTMAMAEDNDDNDLENGKNGDDDDDEDGEGRKDHG